MTAIRWIIGQFSSQKNNRPIVLNKTGVLLHKRK